MRRVATILALAALVLATSCVDEGSSRRAPSAGTDRRELRVYAAASLRPVLSNIERTYEDVHRGVDVVITYGGSSSLARQVGDGAPADVFIAADERSLQPLTASGALGAPVVVATNRLALLVERGNPERIRSLRDAADDDIVLVLCAPAVPCGRLARAWLAAAGVEAEPASLEADAGAVASKVALGEADAGIAYVTDASVGDGAGRLERAAVPEDGLTVDPALQARYVAAAVGEGGRDARAWIALLRSAEGRAAFTDAGFGTP